MCLICDRIKMIKDGTNPYFVKELETGYVVIGETISIFKVTRCSSTSTTETRPSCSTLTRQSELSFLKK